MSLRARKEDLVKVQQQTVSACMIVKNEQEMLPDCLRSIKDIVDELVIVDTGSTDETLTIIEQFRIECVGDFKQIKSLVLLHQEWEGDFSKHRNHGIDHATGDWIFIIDADERLHPEDAPRLKLALSGAKLVGLQLINDLGRGFDEPAVTSTTRLFRRDSKLRYEGRIHNALNIPMDVAVVQTSIRLLHLGYALSSDKMEEKTKRTKEALEREIEEDPKNSYFLYHYIQVCAQDAESVMANPELLQKLIGYARVAWIESERDRKLRHINLMLVYNLAMLYSWAENWELSIRFGRMALTRKNDYLDVMLVLGWSYYHTGDYLNAKAAYLKYLTTQETYEPAKDLSNVACLNPEGQQYAYAGLRRIAEAEIALGIDYVHNLKEAASG